jgi:thioesterase domain-containing protein
MPAIQVVISRQFDYDEMLNTRPIGRLSWLAFFLMPNVSSNPAKRALSPALSELQSKLEREIPMCAQMGIGVSANGADGLVMRLPLDPNRNHQQTAFAGSLNALCTIAGWGSVYLLLRELARDGNIVIRRSSIRYHQPVTTSEILARCHPITAEARQYFLEMLDDKGQAKLDLTVEIAGAAGAAVSFNGSYVVVRPGMAEINGI